MCEDYPCCGHTLNDPCDGTGANMWNHYARMSSPDYDEYYDYP
jgi:hypothetical protein